MNNGHHAAGEGASHFVGLRIPRGQRLTGWVAANRQSIVNSDPALDLGVGSSITEAASSQLPYIPLLVGDQLVGVLTVYSPLRDAFTEDHRRVLEVIGGQISQSFHRAVLVPVTPTSVRLRQRNRTSKCSTVGTRCCQRALDVHHFRDAVHHLD